MSNRKKLIMILFILGITLLIIKLMSVPCFIKTVTGISCPTCGMTRAFNAILNLNFKDACYNNLLSIPLFIFLVYFIIMMIIDIIRNDFNYITRLLEFLKHYYILIVLLLFISFIFNNLK